MVELEEHELADLKLLSACTQKHKSLLVLNCFFGPHFFRTLLVGFNNSLLVNPNSIPGNSAKCFW